VGSKKLPEQDTATKLRVAEAFRRATTAWMRGVVQKKAFQGLAIKRILVEASAPPGGSEVVFEPSLRPQVRRY